MSRKAPEATHVGWRWLAGTVVSVLILAGAAWMTSVSSDGKEVRLDLAQVKKELAEKAADVREIRKDIEIIKESQKAQIRTQEKVDDKLDKLKELLQDEKFRSRPRAN